jgi:hypothetical protein
MRLVMILAVAISIFFVATRSRCEAEKLKQEKPSVVNQEKGKDAEKSKAVKVNIAAKDPKKVFDVVTSARFWKMWHPATYAVAGVTERPYLLGDVIHERVQFAGKDLVVTWKVVEHDRPNRVILQSEKSSSRIIYTFEAKDDVIIFCRELQYDEALFRKLIPDAKELRKLMHEQSEEGLKQLKVLVEKTLRAETTGF